MYSIGSFSVARSNIRFFSLFKKSSQQFVVLKNRIMKIKMMAKMIMMLMMKVMMKMMMKMKKMKKKLTMMM